MIEGINVLSLFDGMSCGRIALEKLGIKVNNYFSCEIDKYALKVANDNFPMDEVNRLGDVTKVNFSDLPKIDLVIGGSPCQGFSFAGKQLAFDDPRSKLFFEFVRAIKETNPTYFMLENVRMKKEFQDIISEYMGVNPICINSALVSAQNRVRYYWTNIPGIEQPEDRNIYLKDIIENGSADRDKSLCVTTRVAGATSKRYLDKSQHQMIIKENSIVVPEATKKGFVEAKVGEGLDLTFINSKTRRGRLMKDKSNCLTASNYEYGIVVKSPKVGRMVGRKINPETGKRDDYNPNLKTEQRIEPRLDDKSGTLTTVTKDNLVFVPHENKKPKNIDSCIEVGHAQIKGHDFLKRVYSDEGKSPTLTAVCGGNQERKIAIDKTHWRKLTPIECERLQTVPDNYTKAVSNSQRYKMLGNGWTVDVIAHIFKNMEF